jgi:CO/xanthine dehydrogenase Mo-binding subunit
VHGPYGAKGVGEPSIIPAAPAIANAVADAVGVRVHELPITGERVMSERSHGHPELR